MIPWRLFHPAEHIRRRHEPGDFVGRTVTIPWPRAEGLGAIRLAAISDIHAHPNWFGSQSIRALIARVNEIDALDAVVMPGDFVTIDERHIDLLAPTLATLAAPVFATTGNHDIATDPDLITATLREHGVTVLRDQTHELAPGLVIVGVDSLYGHNRDKSWIDAAVPAEAQAVVLGHEPQLASFHTQRLHLAGHTHHGQLRFPGVAPLYLPRYSRPWIEGLNERPGGGWVYTSAGIGYTRLPYRLRCPSEITLVVLDPAAVEATVTTEAPSPRAEV